MSSLTVFLFICVVVTCCALPIQRSIEPLEHTEVEEAERRILEELTNAARKKRDTYEYSYSASSKSESSVSWSEKRTTGGTSHVFIIGPGDHNQNYVKIINVLKITTTRFFTRVPTYPSQEETPNKLNREFSLWEHPGRMPINVFA